jgi:hypothetical protein
VASEFDMIRLSRIDIIQPDGMIRGCRRLAANVEPSTRRLIGCAPRQGRFRTGFPPRSNAERLAEAPLTDRVSLNWRRAHSVCGS